MIRGYIRLWRKTQDSAVFQSEGLLKVFIWCLIRAAHKENFITVRTGRGLSEVRLSPGSFLFGRESAAKELNMPPTTVWKRMLKLEKLEILNIERDSHFSIVYIMNWGIYQADREKGDSERDRQGTGKGHKQELKKNIYRQNSLIVLAYLNEKTGKRYRYASFIEARLKDGGTVDECKRIIDAKLKDPYFLENPKFLNPRTLFRPSHWDQYLNEALPLTADSGKSWFKTPNAEVCNA